MADERKSFLLRLDPLLWKDVERWAADELRSVNGQVEFLLREAIRRRRRSTDAASDPTDPAEPS
jgi:hypothetical protein